MPHACSNLGPPDMIAVREGEQRMTEYRHPVLLRDRYRIVAISDQATYEPDAIDRYAVLTPEGLWLRDEETLEAARNWADRHCVDEPEQTAGALRPRRAKTTKRAKSR